MANVERLVKLAKSKRVNRAYYKKYYNINNVHSAGIIQDESKSSLDYVSLENNRDELLYFYGFNSMPQTTTNNDKDAQTCSYFELTISINGLHLNGRQLSQRVACAELFLYDAQTATCYTYKHEQLLDYGDEKEERSSGQTNDLSRVYKIGSLTVETVLPYSLTRILFNGLMQVTTEPLDDKMTAPTMLRSIRLHLSTHPTCDKLDYKYRFSAKYAIDTIKRSMQTATTTTTDKAHASDLLDAFLDDRFEQPLMFQCQIDELDFVDKKVDEQVDVKQRQEFIFWGAKVKRFSEPNDCANDCECLFVWNECGQQVHLSRPLAYKNLVTGLVHNAFDYASHLYALQLSVGGDGNTESGELKTIDFNDLPTLNKLCEAKYTNIKLTAFKCKEYTIEFSNCDNHQDSEWKNHLKRAPPPPFRVRLNGFDGWALVGRRLNSAERVRHAAERLLALNINDHLFGYQLASEQLLGGKGYSLVQLAQLVNNSQLLASASYGLRPEQRVQVSVPRGCIVTSEAYKLWLASDPNIWRLINELDTTRRQLAAKSVNTNPLSSDFIPLGRAQQILRNLCAETNVALCAIPLPEQVRERLYVEMCEIFDEQTELLQGNKLFAVRSSAVGEDSLETSAAGQMRTFLNANNFSMICNSIVACWSSQFELEALTYKCQNGLPFNMPMAVVVQELIQCHVAGVAATCHPLTGNKRKLEITANFGLGESVVAGKATDTLVVSLEQLEYDSRGDEHAPSARLSVQNMNNIVLVNGKEKKDAEQQSSCCLSDEQTIALANMLLDMRRGYEMKDREVEWGITLVDDETSSSSSSSSNASSNNSSANFRIHLLQSRPLTNLQRLSSFELDHELDYGISSPHDVVSRANLGEVMPGALCQLNSTFFAPLTTGCMPGKPYESNMSRKVFAADSFAFHNHMAMMITTYSDTIKRFTRLNESDRELMTSAIYLMIGATIREPHNQQERQFMERFMHERVHPLSGSMQTSSLLRVLALDMGLHSTLLIDLKRELAHKLNEDISSGDEFIKRFNDEIKPPSSSLADSRVQCELMQAIQKLYKRITTRTRALTKGWMCHISGTITSMTFNIMCLKLLANQPAYGELRDNIVSVNVVNDFSVLIRESDSRQDFKKQTESGDISKLLNRLLKSFCDEQLIDRVKLLNNAQELYNYLTDSSNQTASARMFNDFIRRNGHRAFREFCFATKTWADDPSYIVNSLLARLKHFNTNDLKHERERQQALELEHSKKLAEVDGKISGAKFMLKQYAIPRARNATIRRERSKSLLIKALHKYRLAFRHLGGLLCVAGLLPSADLIFHFALEELDEIIRKCCLTSSMATGQANASRIMPRLLYKARRRQQRQKLMDSVNFPTPSLSFVEMFETIRQQTNASTIAHHRIAPNSLNTPSNSTTNQISGLTSCAGRVTGRACVISSLEEVDQIEQNDILVTYSIDISWSVYFFALAGIITEVGGIVSHGAVVAREYGIPTLCTALGACSKFKTGQMITLDADRGVCYANDELDDVQK